MKQTVRISAVAVVLMSLVLAGCQSRTNSRIVGHWTLKKADSLARKVGDADDIGQPERETDAADEQPNRMSITFFASGKLRTETRIGTIASVKEGTWKEMESGHSPDSIKVTCVLTGQQTEHEIRFEDPDLIVWTPPNLAGTRQKLKFIRQQ